MQLATRNAMTEPLEPRRLMSAVPTGGELTGEVGPEPVALLVPAVQAAREAAKAPAATKPLFAFYVEDLDA